MRRPERAAAPARRRSPRRRASRRSSRRREVDAQIASPRGASSSWPARIVGWARRCSRASARAAPRAAASACAVGRPPAPARRSAPGARSLRATCASVTGVASASVPSSRSSVLTKSITRSSPWGACEAIGLTPLFTFGRLRHQLSNYGGVVEMLPQKGGSATSVSYPATYNRVVAHTLDPGRIARLLARTRSGALDRALIAGADPASSPQLAARTTILTSPGFRGLIADGLERLLLVAEGPTRRWWAAADRGAADRQRLRAARAGRSASRWLGAVCARHRDPRRAAERGNGPGIPRRGRRGRARAPPGSHRPGRPRARRPVVRSSAPTGAGP